MPRGACTQICSLTIVIVLLAGCGSRRPADVAESPPAPAPNYGVGDSYQFSDGSTESVVTIDRDAVQWRGRDGSYVTSRDVLLPPLAWTNSTVQGQRNIAAAPPLLFPLRPGKSVVFNAVRTVQSLRGGTPTTLRENWQCDVAGTTRLATAAGPFDTWRVDCTMSEQAGAPDSGVMVQRSLYYAPEIGFYVRRDERMGDGPVQTVELTSYTSAEPALPDSALRQRIAGMQQALERKLSGEAASWRDPATGDAGDVLPVRTVRSTQYGWCRDFAESIRSAGRVYTLRGTGCRNPSGVWDIVALAPARNNNS